MTCPVCGLLNPPGVALCDCGFDFRTRKGGAPDPLSKRSRSVPAMIVYLFLVLIALGLLVEFAHE